VVSPSLLALILSRSSGMSDGSKASSDESFNSTVLHVKMSSLCCEPSTFHNLNVKR
jgi:hypothetical protein